MVKRRAPRSRCFWKFRAKKRKKSWFAEIKTDHLGIWGSISSYLSVKGLNQWKWKIGFPETWIKTWNLNFRDIKSSKNQISDCLTLCNLFSKVGQSLTSCCTVSKTSVCWHLVVQYLKPQFVDILLYSI